MAIKYKGEVSFKDSEGRDFVLRLGMFQFVGAQKELDKLEGREYQLRYFHLALVNGDPSQKDFTLEDAAEIIDDIGFIRVVELMGQTKFGGNVKHAIETEQRQREAALTVAADALMENIDAARNMTTDKNVLKALDKLAVSVNARRAKPEGIANPPQEAILTSA